MFSKLSTTLKPSINRAKKYLHGNVPLVFGFCLFLGVVPFCLLGFFINYGMNQCQKIDQEVARLAYKTKFFVLEMKKREKFKKEFGLKDGKYLQNHVEPTPLMNLDIGLLTQIKNQPSYTKYRPIHERLELLTGEENHIRFVSEAQRSSDYYDESEWKIEKPVLVNSADLKQLLVLLEGVKIDHYLPNPLRPQIFIKKFDVEITNVGGGQKEFTLDMGVIQRGCHEADQS